MNIKELFSILSSSIIFAENGVQDFLSPSRNLDICDSCRLRISLISFTQVRVVTMKSRLLPCDVVAYSLGGEIVCRDPRTGSHDPP